MHNFDYLEYLDLTRKPRLARITHEMDANEQNTEQANNAASRVPVGLKLDPALHAVIEQFRIQEDRPMANMVERLLKTHPRVQEILEAESATTAAPA